jgi:uncharacterized protein (DUF2461 family)
MIEKFDGFSSASIQFLRNLRDNNHKEWFELVLRRNPQTP